MNNDVFYYFLLDISKITVESMMLRWPTLQNITESQIDAAVETLENFGISKENIIKRPKLLNFHPNTLKIRLLVMKECGFSNINMDTLGR